MIESIMIQGAITGAVFALIALGFTVLYGVAGVVNMAHGALLMLGAYMFFAFGPYGFLQLELLQALILAAIFVAIAGSIVYALAIHPVIGDPIAPIVTTVGVAVIVQQLVLIVFGPDYQPVPPFAEGSATVWGAPVLYSSLLACAVSLVLFAVVLIFITKTKIGGAMRAVAQDREVAMLMGINTTRLYALTMAISTSLAVVAGILITSSTTRVAHPYMWQHPLVISFAIVIIGGLGSIKGSLIGAFIIGYAEIVVTSLVPGGGYLKSAVALAIMILILLLRPKGIFGKHIEFE